MELQGTWTEVRNYVFFKLLLVLKLTLHSVTQEVQDYVMYYRYNNTRYEIHLIDSPGFDDGTLVDSQVLSDIAKYVNTSYKLKQRLAGVLYLHDITKGKVGRAAQQNLRMLENMIGKKEYSNCSFVTTKWGCTTNSQDEEQHEMTLKKEKKFFGGMLHDTQHARIERFHPKTSERALEIITPYLKNKFTPQISQQMVDPQGPKLSLGETEAGKVIADNLVELTQTNWELEKVQKAQEILSQKYDEALFSDFNQKRKGLRRKMRWQRTGRWVMRTTILSGAITASVVTGGPGASLFVLVPAFENAASGLKTKEKKQMEELKAQFVKESQNANILKEINPDWLDDMTVQRLEDVESYSLKSGSSKVNSPQVVRLEEYVGIASDGIGIGLDAVGLIMSENWESTDCDTELSELDGEKE